MIIYIGADHRGFELKEKVKTWLSDYKYVDMGASVYDAGDDYTVYAESVARKVAEQKSKGILICGSGVGVDVVANKIDGVRASIGKTPMQVKAGRKDDNMNILVIASDYTSDDEAKAMITEFLETKFSGFVRHKRRLDDIKRIEKDN